MKPRLARLLTCPMDGTPLELVEWESFPRELSPADAARAAGLGCDPADLAREVQTGLLLNRARKIAYPIFRGVPRMLTFETGVAREFLNREGARMERELPGFRLPSEPAMPGEEDVLRTFSTEWTGYEWDGLAYWNLTPDAVHQCMRFMLDLDRHPIEGRRVLEVGIGIGSTADFLARSHGGEVVGIDLSHAVDAAFGPFGGNPFLHIVQASAFHPPFPAESFDLVYSFGVLHHTFSTEEAFRRVCTLPGRGGRLFVWVYSPRDEERTLERRVLMRLENVLRPVCWRLPEPLQTAFLLPLVPLYLLHQNVLRKTDGPEYVRYGWREAVHAARDRFTPRFVHRHTDAEVSGWFARASYGEIRCLGDRDAPAFVPVSFTACTGVDGVREDSAGHGNPPPGGG